MKINLWHDIYIGKIIDGHLLHLGKIFRILEGKVMGTYFGKGGKMRDEMFVIGDRWLVAGKIPVTKH